MNETLQIGQKVSWGINDFKLVGAVMRDLENGFVEIITHTRNGAPFMQKLKAKKELLTKIN